MTNSLEANAKNIVVTINSGNLDLAVLDDGYFEVLVCSQGIPHDEIVKLGERYRSHKVCSYNMV